MKKYNLSNIMKRAWELVKNFGETLSSALKKAWKEAKAMTENIIDTLVANLEDMAYNSTYIRAGMDRQVKIVNKEIAGEKRAYLSIACFTLNGRFKGSYKCGYVLTETGEYVVGKYDDVDAMKKEYLK